MAKCVRVESGRGEDRQKYVKYYYDDGTVEKRIGGVRAWRNNNPGNVVAGAGKLGMDQDGFAIFPDVPTGRVARRALFAKGGKYHGYDSARHMLWGNFDKDGYQINGTGFAPKWDADGKVQNNPDEYADFIGQYFRKYYQTKYNTDMDIERIRMSDYTPEMLEVLEEAQEAKEGFTKGRGKVYRSDNRGNPKSGMLNGHLTGEAAAASPKPSAPRALREPGPIRNTLAPATSEDPMSLFPSPYAPFAAVTAPSGSFVPPLPRRNLLAPAPQPFEKGCSRFGGQQEEYDFFPPTV